MECPGCMCMWPGYKCSSPCQEMRSRGCQAARQSSSWQFPKPFHMLVISLPPTKPRACDLTQARAGWTTKARLCRASGKQVGDKLWASWQGTPTRAYRAGLGEEQLGEWLTPSETGSSLALLAGALGLERGAEGQKMVTQSLACATWGL